MADVPNDKSRFAIAIDTDSGCFAPESPDTTETPAKGEPLFDEQGEPALFLKNQIEFLSRFHGESQRSQSLLKNLKDEGLLTPLNLDITRAADKARFGVRGLLAVDEKKLQVLSAEKAHAFLTSGLLAAIYMHLISLRNFESLANRTGHLSDEAVPWWAK
ncbi:MAG: SapC family protein [Planctomycetota bacterium]|nr:SapC family protein [Planctomycetota bacterium]